MMNEPHELNFDDNYTKLINALYAIARALDRIAESQEAELEHAKEMAKQS